MTLRPILEVAKELGIADTHVIQYGTDKAKVSLDALKQPRSRPSPATLVLVSAITPTPAGEGKTTTTIGLGQALRRLGKKTSVALREPSLGPCFGVKGGGTGGGASQIEPATKINLHFNGDFHAVSSAHNLLASMIDNHLHHGNALDIEPSRVLWPRVVDMNDRALRNILIGLGGKPNGIPRESSFEITAASEIMAILCLANDIEDLHQRIDRTVVAFTRSHSPVTAGDLGATGAMVALLAEAIVPNLAQTTDGTPAFVHGGPFANIAHGCNSILATRMALHHSDWVITEAGFGGDLGAEKFFNIKCVEAGLNPAVVVLVATVRALKMHGGVSKKDLNPPNPSAVRAGLCNLEKHIENVRSFGKHPVVAINQFANDTEEELKEIQTLCGTLGVRCALSNHFAEGGAGAEALAHAVIDAAGQPLNPLAPTYTREQSPTEKIRQIATSIYGADDISLTTEARRDLRLIERLGLTHLPVCMAKTQSSLSDDPKKPGRPIGFTVSVRRIRINTGAGFLVVLTGNIMRMPGLPKVPQAKEVTVTDGHIEGIG